MLMRSHLYLSSILARSRSWLIMITVIPAKIVRVKKNRSRRMRLLYYPVFYCTIVRMTKTGRRTFIGGILGSGAVGALAVFMKETRQLPKTDRMPVAFVGHGTPRSATAPNPWTASWEMFGNKIPRPAAIF